MVITYLFMIASVSLIIFVPIYIKKKDKEFKFNNHDKFSLKRKKKTIKTLWDIDKVQDCVIYSKNSHSIIIELGSIEYKLLNEDEQNNIDNSLIRISKTLKSRTQFFSTIEKIDTTDKIEQIRNNLNKQNNERIREYGESIIDYLENIMLEDNLYVRKNYIVITSYEPSEKARNELMEYYFELKLNLSSIKITTRLLTDSDIIELFNRELNKNSNEKIKNIIDKGGLDFYVQAKSKT